MAFKLIQSEIPYHEQKWVLIHPFYYQVACNICRYSEVMFLALFVHDNSWYIVNSVPERKWMDQDRSMKFP